MTPGPGGTVNLTVTGVGGVPATGVSAIVLNTTVAASTGAGFVTTYPTGSARPVASSLNFVAGQTVANRVVVPVGANGQVSLYNSNGSTPLVVDVTGWYTDGSDASAGGAYYVAVTPHRLVDTRDGTGASKARVGPGGVLPVQVAGQDGLPASNAAIPPNAAALTVTVVDPTAAVYATVYPSLSAQPLASDLNANPGQDVPNLALADLGTDGAVDVFNSHGDSDYVVDLSGYFIGAVDVPSSTTATAPGAITSVSGDPTSAAAVTLAAGTTAPPIGQILTSGVTPATPQGLLVQVTGVNTDSSGAPVLTTQPATLQQAVGSANIAVAVPLSATDVQTNGHATVIGPRQLRARSLRTTTQIPITRHAEQPCTADASSSVDVSASISPTLVFDAQLGHHGLTPSITATAGVQLTEQTSASVVFDGTVDCEWNAQLAQYSFTPIEFDVAGVPVVIVPVFTVTMQATATGQAQISASVTQNFTAQAGLHDDNGTVTPYHSVSDTITHSGPSITAANANASVAVTADLAGKLYGIAGPDIALTGTVNATVNPTASPWWTVGFTLTGTIALHVTVLIAEVDVSTSINLLSVTVAQSGGPSTGAPPVITTTKLPDADVNLPYSTDLTTADHRAGTWTITNGTLPNGLYLSGFTISGQPGTPGTSAFTLRFTDTTGHTVTAQATITVISGNGTITGHVTDTHGHSLANVTVWASSSQNTFLFTTDTNGDYDATNLPSGQYSVCFDGSNGTGGTSDATGYAWSCYGSNPDGVSVAPNATVSGIDITLAVGGAVSGQLTNSTGGPEANAIILVIDNSGGFGIAQGTSSSNSDGSFEVKGLTAGSYTFCFAPNQPATTQALGDADQCYQNKPFSVDQSNKATPVDAVAGQTVTGIDVTFTPGGAISGRLTDSNGQPLANVVVSASGAGTSNGSAAGFDSYSHETITDASGDYLIGNLAPGTQYNVCQTGAATDPFSCYGGDTLPLAAVPVTVDHITPNISWSVPTTTQAERLPRGRSPRGFQPTG